MNYKREIDKELDFMRFDNIEKRAVNLQISKKSSMRSMKVAVAVVLSAALIGVSAYAVWDISGLAGSSLDLTHDEYGSLESYAYAPAEEDIISTYSEHDVRLDGILFDGTVLYADIVVSRKDGKPMENGSACFIDFLEITNSENQQLFGLCSATGGDNSWGMWRVDDSIQSGSKITLKTGNLAEHTDDGIKVTDYGEMKADVIIPEAEKTIMLHFTNKDGDSFDAELTPLSFRCKGTGEIANYYGGKKYRYSVLLYDENDKVIFNTLGEANGNYATDDYFVVFDKIAPSDKAVKVTFGDYTAYVE